IRTPPPGKAPRTRYHRGIKGSQGFRMELPTRKIVPAGSPAARAFFTACSAARARARPSRWITCPAAVRRTPRLVRSSSDRPSRLSKALASCITEGADRYSCWAARLKLPHSATQRKVRRFGSSRGHLPGLLFHLVNTLLAYWLFPSQVAARYNTDR